MKTTIKRLAVLAVCALTLCGTAAAGYSDVPENVWYAKAADYCRSSGLMSGTGGGNFSPDLPMTRAMLASVLYRLSGLPAVSGADGFADVADSAWYAAPVLWASRNGYMQGYGSGRFGPDDPITRQQAAAVLWRFQGSPAVQAEEAFADQAEIAGYALQAAAWAKSAGVISGVPGNRFDPEASVTRAQMAVILMNCAGAAGRISEVSAMDVMCQPCGIAAMADGSLLVTDTYNKAVWRVADGKSTIYAGDQSVADYYGQPMGGYLDDSLAKSLFRAPWAIVPFLNGWAVSDAENNVVRFFRSDGGAKTQVTDLGIVFQHPTGLAVDEHGNLYVSETFAGTIKRVTPKGTVTTLAAGLAEPMGLCWKDGTLYVAESGCNRILKISGSGKKETVAGSGEDGSADGTAAQSSFSGPMGVAVGDSGEIYVADTGNSAIRRIQNDTVTTVLTRDPADTELLFPVSPTGLLIHENVLYISDTFSRKLLVMPLR